MHIAEGFLPPVHAVAWGAAAAGLRLPWGVAAAHLLRAWGLPAGPDASPLTPEDLAALAAAGP